MLRIFIDENIFLMKDILISNLKTDVCHDRCFFQTEIVSPKMISIMQITYSFYTRHHTGIHFFDMLVTNLYIVMPLTIQCNASLKYYLNLVKWPRSVLCVSVLWMTVSFTVMPGLHITHTHTIHHTNFVKPTLRKMPVLFKRGAGVTEIQKDRHI